MIKQNLIEGTFIIFALIFVIFMNLQGFYIMKMQRLLKTKYFLLHRKLIFHDFGYALFIPRPFRLIKFVWFTKIKEKEIYEIVRKIRIFLIMAVLSLLFTVLMPLTIELAFPN